MNEEKIRVLYSDYNTVIKLIIYVVKNIQQIVREQINFPIFIQTIIK